MPSHFSQLPLPLHLAQVPVLRHLSHSSWCTARTCSNTSISVSRLKNDLTGPSIHVLLITCLCRSALDVPAHAARSASDVSWRREAPLRVTCRCVPLSEHPVDDWHDMAPE